MCTSGTTGKPRGAVLTHKNQLMKTADTLFESSKVMKWGDDERVQTMAPLFHEAALALALVTLFVNNI